MSGDNRSIQSTDPQQSNGTPEGEWRVVWVEGGRRGGHENVRKRTPIPRVIVRNALYELAAAYVTHSINSPPDTTQELLEGGLRYGTGMEQENGILGEPPTGSVFPSFAADFFVVSP